jgi:Txe/YoeB family toxin of toxin-antitoxin system
MSQARKRYFSQASEKTGNVLLLLILAKSPLQTPPPYEKLVGELSGAYSRRINIQHRLVYQIMANIKTVKVLRMWTYYE